jgi:glycosyltransferase involved in cell wall biosynthesis
MAYVATQHKYMDILRIHFSPGSKNGAEYDVAKVNRVVREFGGVDDRICNLFRQEKKYGFQRHNESLPLICSSLAVLRETLESEIVRSSSELIHLHSMPYHEITRMILGMGLPVIRTSHEPMLTCPGWSRFLLKDNAPCTKEFGPGCLVNAYTKCCQQSRLPWNLYDSYRNVGREIREFFPQYKRLIVNSNYLAETLLVHGARLEQVVVAPSPQYALPGGALRRTPSERIPIIFAGRVSRPKGVLVLLEAYRILLAAKCSNCSLEIIGEGSELDELRRLTAHQGLKHVNFHGWVDRKALSEMFGRDGIAVTPSVYPDHFPNVVAEAMLCGAPVVASNSGGTSEWFEHGISGISYDYKSPDELAKVLRPLLEDQQLRLQLGAAGREHIRLHHSPEKTASFYRALYEEVILEH